MSRATRRRIGKRARHRRFYRYIDRVVELRDAGNSPEKIAGILRLPADLVEDLLAFVEHAQEESGCG